MTPAYIINTILYTGSCLLLLYITFRQHIPRIALPRLIMAIILFSAIAAAGSYAFTSVISSPLLRMLCTMPVIFLGTGLFCTETEYNFWQGVFIIAVTKCYAENVRLIALYLYFITARELPGSSDLYFAQTTFILTALSFYSIYRFFSMLLLPALDCTIALDTWKFMWIVPMCNTVIHTLLVSPDTAVPSVFPGNEFYFIPPLWTIMTFSTYGILLRMITKLSQNAYLAEALKRSETQIAAQQKQLENLQLHAEKVRRMRHDTRHHIMALKGLLKSNDNKKLEAYLHELSENLTPLPKTYCESPSVNALLCHYHNLAEEEKIDTDFLVSLPDELPFSETDLCIILGNFLENAIEACRRMESQNRFITLKMTMPGRCTLVIMTENSYEGTIQRAKDGSFLSSKERNRKGIGIASVLNVTEKYNGVPRFEYQNNVFKASLLLNAKLGTG